MTLEEKIIDIVSKSFGVEKENVTPESDFFNDLNLDKLEVADLVIKIQHNFNIAVKGEEISRIKTVADLVSLVDSKSDEF